MVKKIVTPIGAAAPVFVPGTTFGRSGYQPQAPDELADKIRCLDALMSLITERGGSGDRELALQNLNDDIQTGVLDLVGSLARDIHELHERIFIEDVNERVRPRSSAAAAAGG